MEVRDFSPIPPETKSRNCHAVCKWGIPNPARYSRSSESRAIGHPPSAGLANLIPLSNRNRVGKVYFLELLTPSRLRP